METQILIWYVRGDTDGKLWSTKDAAERHARKLFPLEDAAIRYSRVMYRTIDD